ncbi:MAG: bacteriophage Gp15 family protein [Oscillospiraceae bacterium]|nr:bacteriophage Gp15 family protein [Oscillospiraceae bacterium]
MNLLIDTLPLAYEFGGRVYKMQTDFREWIKFELLFTDKDITPKDKKLRLLEIIFPEIPPVNEELWDFLLWFYQCGGEPVSSRGGKGKAKKETAVYSFEYDDGYIYADFMSVYQIDLADIPYLHWWKFKAMFRSLHDCKMSAIMQYRAEEITSKTPAYRKDFLMEMKRVYALPRSISEQQKINELKRLKEQMGV